MNTLSTKALGAACKPCAGSQSRELYQLSRGDRKEAMKLLKRYVASRAVAIKSGQGYTHEMRSRDANYYRVIRRKLLALLGPGFPALARAFRVARVLSRET